MIYVILAFGFLAASLPAISVQASDSGCPAVTTFPNLRSAALAGRWYLQSRERSYSMPNRKCFHIDFSVAENRVTNYTITSIYVKSGQYDRMIGIVEIPDSSTESKWKVMVTLYPNDPPRNYWILDTDYQNYLTLYTCDSGSPKLNIFTKQQRPSNDVLLVALESTFKHGFTPRSFMWYDHGGCPN